MTRTDFTLATARELTGQVVSAIPTVARRKTAKIGIIINQNALKEAITNQLAESGVTNIVDGDNLDVLLVGDSLRHDEQLQDANIQGYIQKLRVGGVLLFRLDLDKHSAIMPQITLQFEHTTFSKGSDTFGLDMNYVKPVLDSIAVRGNHKDLVWCLSKVTRDPAADGFITERDFLDKTQYQVDGIKAYEFVFGEGFISPGGRDQNTSFLNELRLSAGERMLDIGSGIGGSPLQVAQEYGISCVGVDLSTNMLNLGIDMAHEAKDPRVSNMVANVMLYDFPDNSFDIIYSRDCIQHIDDIDTLYKRLYRWLRPGGRLLTTQYTAGKAEFSEQFAAYTKQRHYGLKNKDEFLHACQSAGFTHFAFKDLTPLFTSILHKELKFADEHKDEFVAKFSADRFRTLTDGWRDKLKYIDADNHNWTQMYCEK